MGLSNMTGDPLLDPNLMQRIEFASQFASVKEIFFSSNGIGFKNQKLTDNLIGLSLKIKPKIKIDISLPGFEKNMFERVYGVGGYEDVLQGMTYLLKTNKENNNTLDISLHLQPDRGGILKDPDYFNYIRPHINEEKVLHSSRVENNWCGQIKQEDLTGEMILRRPLKRKDIPCQFLLDGHLDILVNGDVRMCGCTYGAEGKHDSLVIGNINRDSLANIWFGSNPQNICEKFVNSELPSPCQKCFMYGPY